MLRRIVRRAGVGVAAVVGFAGNGDAQTPKPEKVDVWVMEAHVKTRTSDWHAPDPRGPVQRMLVRTLRYGSIVRTEFIRDPNVAWDGSSTAPVGMALLTTTTDTGVVVTLIDPAQKQITPLALAPDFPSDLWINGVWRDPSDTTWQPSPHDPVMHVRDVSVEVTQAGAGPAVQGHATTRYQQTQRATLVVSYDSLMSTTVKSSARMNVDVATDIPDAPPIDLLGMSRSIETSLGIALTRAFEPALRTAAAKYPRGVVVHIEGQQLSGSPSGTITRIFEIDVDRWSRMQVDASLFVVPKGYNRGVSMFFR